MAALRGGRTDDPGPSIDLAYQGLPAVAARVFRLLSVHPGPAAPTAAVAAMTGLTFSDTHSILASLSRVRLIEAAPGSTERWRMRGRERAAARRLSDAHAAIDGRPQAIARLLSYYQAATEAADGYLRGLPPIPVQQEFTDRDGALGWLDAERDSLVAAARVALDTGLDQAAKSLPLLMSYYLNFRGLCDDLLAVTAIGLDAARRLGDRAAEGESLNNKGTALIGLKRYDEALTAYEEAAAIVREAGDHQAQGELAANLGVALSGLRRYEEALTAYQAASAIFREARDRHGEGTALNNIGTVRHALGQYDEARAAYQEAVAVFRQTGDRHSLATALGNLANVFRSLGRSDEAAETYQEAARFFGETGDDSSELAALGSVIAARAAT